MLAANGIFGLPKGRIVLILNPAASSPIADKSHEKFERVPEFSTEHGIWAATFPQPAPWYVGELMQFVSEPGSTPIHHRSGSPLFRIGYRLENDFSRDHNASTMLAASNTQPA